MGTGKVMWVVIDRAGYAIVGHGTQDEAEALAGTMRGLGRDVFVREADFTEGRQIARAALREKMATCDDCDDGPQEPSDEAMFQGHAGHSCKQISDMADRNIGWCAEAQKERDRAREEARLWRALRKAETAAMCAKRDGGGLDDWLAEKADAEVGEVRAALCALGIDPDAQDTP